MLKYEFDMKELGHARRILGMEICRGRAKGVLTLSQKSYIEKVLPRFNMTKAKVVTTPIGQHFKLSSSQSPQNEKERSEMDCIPYESSVGSIMYNMDLGYATSIVTRYFADLGREYWDAVKWVLRYLNGSSEWV